MAWNRDNRIENGDTVKDRISGFTGTVTAITHWLNGCLRFTVQGKKLQKGVPTEPHCFDAEQIVLVKKGPKRKEKPSGGPKPAPTRNPDPKR